MSDRRGSDAALVGRVRRRLLAWSGGSTLVVLLVLGSVLYAAVAGSLAKAATDQLTGRAKSVVGGVMAGIEVPPPGNLPMEVQGVTTIDAQPGLVIGGPASGTVAIVTQVGSGASILIAGFTISGNVPRLVLIRGIGPGLSQFGVTDVLANPILTLFRGPTQIGENDDWGGTGRA